MNEDVFNMEIRKFLKLVGVTSQREIEEAVRAAVRSGKLKGTETRKARLQLTLERLFHDKVKLPDPGFPFQEEEVMLPPRMVNELGKVFPTGEVSFAANANLFFARDPQGETTFASRRIGGKFPVVAKILPKFDHTLTVPRQDLADALSRMGSVVKGKPVQLSFKEKELHLQSRTGTGSAEEFIDLSTPAPSEIAIAFNLEYLADAISLFSADELRVAVSTPFVRCKFVTSGSAFSSWRPSNSDGTYAARATGSQPGIDR